MVELYTILVGWRQAELLNSLSRGRFQVLYGFLLFFCEELLHYFLVHLDLLGLSEVVVHGLVNLW